MLFRWSMQSFASVLSHIFNPALKTDVYPPEEFINLVNVTSFQT